MDKGILDYALNHKYTLAFAAGFATAVIGVMLLKSDAVKEITDKGLDTVMTAKNDIEETFQDVNDDAEDIGVFSFDELDDLDIAFDHRMILSEVKDYLENN